MKDIGDSTGGAASVALAEALKINTSLQTLRLDGMGVGLEEARRLGHSLRHNSNLRWIKLNPVASLPVFRFRPSEGDVEDALAVREPFPRLHEARSCPDVDA